MNANNDAKVSIVILNYNRAADTIKCVTSFLSLQYPNYEIIVVDNASTDDSVNVIKERIPNITLLQTGKNLGYSGGNNFGIKYAMEKGADYFLIINNDTELINPYFLQEIINNQKKDSSIGIMGPKVLNPGIVTQKTILFTPTLLNSIRHSISFKMRCEDNKNYNVSQRVESISGVCWLIKRKVIEDIGLLDEDYFMYAEEQDYCYRSKKAGWKIAYYPIESIIHYKESVDKDEERNLRQYIYARRNQVLFLRKHFGFLHASTLAILFIISNILKIISIRLRKGKDNFL